MSMHWSMQAYLEKVNLNSTPDNQGSDGQLQGVLGAHADDTITGGPGSKYESAVRFLRDRFPFRKWRTGQGQFLVTFYQQG